MPRFANGVPENLIENKEKKVIWSGSVGLDIIFVRERYKGGWRRRPFLLEVNGNNSGFGMAKMPVTRRHVLLQKDGFEQYTEQDLPKDHVPHIRRLFANTRGSYEAGAFPKMETYNELINSFIFNAKDGQQIDLEEIASPHTETGFSTPEIAKKVLARLNQVGNRIVKPIHANKNPRVIRKVTSDKLDMYTVLQKYDQPQQISMDHFESSGFGDIKSSTDKWVVKPRKGTHSEGIEIFEHNPNIRFFMDDVRSRYEKKGIKFESKDFIMQEMLVSDGAESQIGTELEGRPASMRLLVDFTIMEGVGGKRFIKINYADAFQRVSQYSDDEEETKRKIVCSSTGAYTRRASDAEIQDGLGVAYDAIQCLDKVYEAVSDQGREII